MPAYDNTAVAAKLDLAADLLEIAGADKFRFLSYRKAANAVRALPEQIAAVANAGRLTEIPGVGVKMAVNIEQIIGRGSFDVLDEVSATVPPTLADVMQVPGVGPKRAALLHEKLGVATIADLVRALEAGRVAGVGGFGVKTADNIAAGVSAFERHHERTPIGVALPVAEQLASELGAVPGAIAVEPAGSVRRREETIGDIDLVAASERPSDLISVFTGLPAVERILGSGDTKASVELHDGLQVDLRVVAPESYGAALQYFTGNKDHNVALRELAKQRGLKVNEYGVFRVNEAGDELERLGGATEGEIYGALGLDTPAPEIRWGTGELELAADHSLPRLVVLGDVLCDLQSHSTATDGKNSLEVNRAMASQLGYEYLAATDHALNLRMVGGLDLAGLESQWAEIDELNSRGDGPLVLKGIELNIADDGSVDYDEEVLARFDIVLASLHSGWDQGEATATKRMLAAIANPWVDVIAHPTGRVIGRRDPIRLDMEAVLSAAGETKTIMEINSYPDRLDLSAEHIRLARHYGVRFSLGTDAHAAEQMRYMRYGVAQARRGLVTREELVNAHPWAVARTWLKRARPLGWS
ncbi:MAG TPA: DNA polymerase/3'-5' exonuclease PolX [Coriobacteriia bacterium]